ncbi:MAG: hypothetical protein GC200_08565 [Tepidisphaera sp.]|nr:hypothetical protein [Tepidisphaera sp.]
MPAPAKPGTHNLNSIWCIPAAASPGLLVLARYAKARDIWTHLALWTPGKPLQHGAWARLRLITSACRVCPDAQFLCYAATRPNAPRDAAKPRPFAGSGSGGLAVSRVPWLSALTDVVGRTFMSNSGGPSKHALTAAEQQNLWDMFHVCLDFPDPTYLGEPDAWLAAQQPGWTHLSPQEVQHLTRWPVQRAGKRDAYGRSTPVVLSLPNGLQKCWIGQLACQSGRLLVRIPTRNTRFLEGIGHVRYCWQQQGQKPVPMPDAKWAWIDAQGQLLVATKSGHLETYRPARRSDKCAPGLSGWRLHASLDISTLTPSPGPSPSWARQSLAARTDRSASQRKRQKPTKPPPMDDEQAS